MIETFGVLTGLFGGYFGDVVVAWGYLEAFKAFLGCLGAIDAIWGLPGIFWCLSVLFWGYERYLGAIFGLSGLFRRTLWAILVLFILFGGIFWDYSGLQGLARGFHDYSGGYVSYFGAIRAVWGPT